MNEYLGDIPGPADDGRALGLGPVLSAVAAVSVDVGRMRAAVESLTAEHALAAKQLGRLTGLSTKVDQLQQRTIELETLAETVTDLSAQVQQLISTDPAAPPPRPVDWAHVADEERDQWSADLVAWVRDVLYPGWPHALDTLPACWPRHRDLVNDISLLRTSYEVAYEHPAGRVHHAVDFRRLLEDVLRSADARYSRCPTPGIAPHPPPRRIRDDSDELLAAQRAETLAELYVLVEQTNDERNPQELRAAASERARWLAHHHQITPTEYTEYEQAAKKQR